MTKAIAPAVPNLTKATLSTLEVAFGYSGSVALAPCTLTLSNFLSFGYSGPVALAPCTLTLSNFLSLGALDLGAKHGLERCCILEPLASSVQLGLRLIELLVSASNLSLQRLVAPINANRLLGKHSLLGLEGP